MSSSSDAAVIVERVETPGAFSRLRELLEEYENALPPELRHSEEPAFDAAFLARCGSDYVGCAGASGASSGNAVLQRMYVQPAHRGKGAARSLAQAAISYARERGCERIVLDTNAERMQPAYALYRSLGFAECEPYGEVDYACPTFMELRLR